MDEGDCTSNDTARSWFPVGAASPCSLSAFRETLDILYKEFQLRVSTVEANSIIL